MTYTIQTFFTFHKDVEVQTLREEDGEGKVTPDRLYKMKMHHGSLYSPSGCKNQ